MNKLIIDLCKNVLEHGENYIEILGDRCKGIDCLKDNCPFFKVGCCDNRDEHIEIAKEYIKKSKLEEVDKMKKKTFKEIVSDIEENEIWEDENFIVELDDCGCIKISHKDGYLNCSAIGIDPNGVFKLRREECNTSEAIISFNNGKEIQSCLTSNTYKKISENNTFINGEVVNRTEASMLISELQGNWYINN